MASGSSEYPDFLNPFGNDEEEDTEPNHNNVSALIKIDEYPDHLSPFGDSEDNTQSCAIKDDYDDSLNPFGISEQGEEDASNKVSGSNETTQSNSVNTDAKDSTVNDSVLKNPFDEENDKVSENQESIVSKVGEETTTSIPSISQPDSLEPPKPLPRTKSLLKKEQAFKNRQLQQQQLATEQTPSLVSNASSTSSSSNTLATNTVSNANMGSFQRKKNKRAAPPVPINFKRQVSGSLDAIEEELNHIGDMVTVIEKESILCQESLKSNYQVNESEFTTSRSKYIELIKRKNSIVRRQKELMYKKRELKLDQIYSDIEYELRMIGNKQLSTRTNEDEIKEKQLLKKLVEIVEEKNDIVENLNKDTTCDNHDIEEAFRRLNINISPEKQNGGSIEVAPTNCDKKKHAKFTKFSTLLPKSGTLKNTIKIKRKKIFKKCDPGPIER